ncbi:MAG: hypothetical protein V4813_12760 [Gemmatimonadota bacterium]
MSETNDRLRPIPVERETAPGSGHDAKKTKSHGEAVSDLELAALEAALEKQTTVRAPDVTSRDAPP